MRIARLPACLAPLSLLFLAGCLTNPPSPQSVAVSSSGIEVEMSDRTTCLGPAPQPGQSWSGTLQGCNAPYPYRVTLNEGGNPIRSVLVEGAAAIGIELAPIARVEIDGPAGNTWTFASPPPSPFDE